LGWFGSAPGSLAHVNPLLKFTAGRRATASVAARQVRSRHLILVIRATEAPQNRTSTDSRAVADQSRLPQRRSLVASFIAGLEGPERNHGYVAAGVVLHFDLFRVGVVGRRQR
jgi:hypothetical protein